MIFTPKPHAIHAMFTIFPAIFFASSIALHAAALDQDGGPDPWPWNGSRDACIARVAELEAQVAEQQAHIDRLELTAAKVGLPPLEDWSLHLGLWAMFLIGLAGEGVFFLRFVVQWYASEKRKQTVVPLLFWHLSLIGTFMVLAYAIYIINWVFILAYSLNVFLYVRNLSIARRTNTAARGPGDPETRSGAG